MNLVLASLHVTNQMLRLRKSQASLAQKAQAKLQVSLALHAHVILKMIHVQANNNATQMLVNPTNILVAMVLEAKITVKVDVNCLRPVRATASSG